MRKLVEIVRANDWWEYKFPPMLAMAYVIVLKSKFTFVDTAVFFPIILAALITGAAYVSILNDATDIAEDALAGKRNKMMNFSKPKIIALVLLPLLIAISLIQFLFGWGSVTSVFYILSYICFTLYSLPPFRLKKRGFAGILADACGSQVFPTLFIIVYFLNKTHQVMSTGQLILIGSWLLGFGLRGILWHQLHDLKNDRISGLVTFIQKLNDGQILTLANIIISVELLSFILFLIFNQLLWIIAGLVLYMIFILFTFKTLQIKQIIIKPLPGRTRILMFEFYQVFFPLIILCQCSFKSPVNVIALILHIVLFPKNASRIAKEMIG